MAGINAVHPVCVDEDQHDKDEDGTLVCEPKAKGKATEVELIQRLNKNDAEQIGDNEPNGKEPGHEAKVVVPVGLYRALAISIPVFIGGIQSRSLFSLMNAGHINFCASGLKKQDQ